MPLKKAEDSRFWKVILLGLMTSLLSLPVVANTSNYVPEFCEQNFPVLDASQLEQLENNEVTGRQCQIQTHAGLSVSVEAENILQFYGNVQQQQYARAVERFQQDMREKVARRIVQSREAYMNLFPRMSCEHLSDGWVSRARTNCEQDANVELSCSDPALAQAIREEEQAIDAYNLESARQRIIDYYEGQDGEEAHPDYESFDPSLIGEADVQDALHFNERFKRQTFIARNLEASLRARALFEARKQAVVTRDQQLANNPCSSTRRGTRCTPQETARRETIERNYQIEHEEIQFGLSRLYEQYPTVFNLETNTSWLIFKETDYQMSPLAESLLERADRVAGEEILDIQGVEAFISDSDKQTLVMAEAHSLIDEMPADFEEKGRAEVHQELKNSQEVMKSLCENDGSGLHNFEQLAYELLLDAQDDPETLVDRQAGFCYLRQRHPPRDGGLPTYMLVGAGAAIVVGVGLQFVPGIGTAGGAAAIAYGAGVLGGAVFAYDAYDRYSVSRDQNIDQEIVYQGNYAWTSAEDLLRSRDRRATDRNLALIEGGLSAVDVAFFGFRPVRHAVIGSLRGSDSAATVAAPINRAAPVEPRNVVTVVDEVPPQAQRVAPVVETPPPLTLSEAPIAPSSPAVVSGADSLPIVPRVADTPPVVPQLEAPARPLQITGPSAVDTPPRITHVPAEPVAAVARVGIRSENAILTPEQVQRIETFFQSGHSERARIVEGLTRRMQDLSEADFMLVVMHLGRYTPDAFSPGPQEMARRLYQSLSNPEEARAILQSFYRGKTSADSQRRLAELTRLFDAPPNVPATVAQTPTAPPPPAAASAADDLPIIPRASDVPPTAAQPPAPLQLTGSGAGDALPRIDRTVPQVTHTPGTAAPAARVGIRSENAIIAPEQVQRIETFFQSGHPERARIVEGLTRRMRDVGDLSESDFLLVVMHLGRYSPDVFSVGPQEMARRLYQSIGNPDEARAVLQNFYRGKTSADSQRRLAELTRLIDDVNPVPNLPVVAPGTHVAVRGGAEGGELAARRAGEAATDLPAQRVLEGEVIPPERTTTVAPATRREGVVIEGTATEIPPAGTATPPRATASEVPPAGGGLNLTSDAPTSGGSILQGIRDFGMRAYENTIPALTAGFRALLRSSQEAMDQEEPADDVDPPAASLPPGDEPEAEPDTPQTPDVPEAAPDFTLELEGVTLTDAKTHLIIPVELKARIPLRIPDGVHIKWEIEARSEAHEDLQDPETTSGETSRIEMPLRESAYALRATAFIEGSEEEPLATLLVPVEACSHYADMGAECGEEQEDPPAEEEAEFELIFEVSEPTAVADTATAKIKATIKPLNEGDELPEGLSITWEITSQRTGTDTISPPSAHNGAEVEVTVNLLEHGYFIQATAKRGDATIGSPQERLVRACTDFDNTNCDPELDLDDTPQVTPWPNFPAQQPPGRFQPVNIPQPQMYVIPGWY